MEVHFIDDTYLIDNAESLAQIGHFHRRNWAVKMFRKLETEKTMIWQNFQLNQHSLCPFEKRLMAENWHMPTVALMLADTHKTLYVYRLYISLIFQTRIVFSFPNALTCRYLQYSTCKMFCSLITP